MILTVIAFVTAYFFAMNIGASGAAASMGVAYGAGALSKKNALILCAIGIILGAVIGGGEVTKTIGKGIMPSNLLTVEIVVIILMSAALSLFFSNMVGIPLSTSEVTVGAVVGVGVAFHSLYFKSLLEVISWWIVVPILALFIAWLGGKFIHILKKRTNFTSTPQKTKTLSVILIFAGFFEAFSAGMNNVANAIGPLVGAGIISINLGTITGGLFVALGVVVWGGRVVETNGKKITNLTHGQGILISSLTAALVIVASLFGMPIPMTQITTSAIVGVGMSEKGFTLKQKETIIRILKVWIVSPVFSLVVAYALINLLIIRDYYISFVIMSVMIATFGSLSLYKMIKMENQSFHDQGGGI